MTNTISFDPVVNRHYQKKVIDANFDISRREFLDNAALVLQEKKHLQRELVRECHKARFESFALTDNGTLLLEVKNRLLPITPTEVSNLTKPKLKRFSCAEDRNSPPIYAFSCTISNSQRTTYLRADKLAHHGYILQKLNRIGAVFYLKSRNKTSDLLINFITALISTVDDETVVPRFPGWFINEEQQPIFYSKEDPTWERLTKLAR